MKLLETTTNVNGIHEYEINIFKTKTKFIVKSTRTNLNTGDVYNKTLLSPSNSEQWTATEIEECFDVVEKTWNRLQERIGKERDKARSEAETAEDSLPFLRSRGALLTASTEDGDRVDDGGFLVTTKKTFLQNIASLRSQGAVEFSIQGGFDGGWILGDIDVHNVSEWGFDPMPYLESNND